jgi:hypothetical protein
VPDHSATLGLADEIRVPLNGNHSTIVKYSSEQDNNFRLVSRTITRLIRDARNHAEMYAFTFYFYSE